MLVLSRKPMERIVIGEDIVVTIVSVRGDKVRVGVDAPASVPINRHEIAERIAAGLPAPPKPGTQPANV